MTDRTSIVRIFHNGPVKRIRQGRQDIITKWSGEDGVNLVFPRKQARISDGVIKMLRSTCEGHICEVGCGTGRIAKIFNPNRYIGVDINETAVKKARDKCPDHNFKCIAWDDIYPMANTYLFFTVMLHIPDHEIEQVVGRLSGRVVIVESMGRWKREYGRGNNYHRDPSDYRKLFEKIGMSEKAFARCHDLRYPFETNFQVFSR